MTLPSVISGEEDWKVWARKLSIFLGQQEDRAGLRLVPSPVLLSHATDSFSNIGLERNFVEGIMLYDPVTKTVILSRDGIWAPLFDALTTSSIFSVAAYGSMELSGPPVAGLDIPVGSWIPITQFDSNPTPFKGVVVDFTTDTFSLDFEGVYRVSLSFSLDHDDIASMDREFSLRLFNITSATGGSETKIGVARKLSVTNFTSTFLINIAEVNKGDDSRIAVGLADVMIEAVIWTSLNLSIDMVSEWKEPIQALEAPGP